MNAAPLTVDEVRAMTAARRQQAAEARLHHPNRRVRLREKLNRMPEGTFTFAPGIEGAEKNAVAEALVDLCLHRFAAEPKLREIVLATDEIGFRAKFTRDA